MNISWPTILIAVGSVIAVMGAFWAALDKAASDRRWHSLAIENKKLSEELRSSVTGGDSFPLVIYGPALKNISDPDLLGVTISVQGKFPLFDVTLEHVDLTEKLDPAKYATDMDFIAAFMSKRLPTTYSGTLHTNTATQVGVIHLIAGENEKHLRLTTLARNGRFSQFTDLKRDDSGSWRMAHYKIVKEVSLGEEHLLKEENLEK